MEKNSLEKNGVHVLYKNLGETPLQSILKFKKENPQYQDEPMTYAGRLDPMAEGVLLVLSGEEVKNKEKYLGLNKTYEVEMLWGFETDTLDVLGLVSGNSFNSSLSGSTHNLGAPNLLTLGSSASESLPSRLESTNFLKKSVGKFEQLYPLYSSKPVNGKPLFEWAREGKIEGLIMPKHEVEVFSADFISRKTILKSDLLKNIEIKVNSVSGDFRQSEILKKWREVLNNISAKEFVIDKFVLNVSSGFYVRQFVSDLAKSLGSNAITFHIKRTELGDFALKD